ncbi:MAG: arsenate reductase (glutaredoxin) [Candidatus Neomarinimicrobiota bacterium]|nr:MAG: arsenate reductase (glutaredoxin) [Candidatus Neomarinimicrobiota bacterium]
MDRIQIYHNPRCRKSREGLQYLRDHGVEPEIIDYLNHPPTPDELKTLAQKLGLRPKDFIRRQEADFKELGLKAHLDDDDYLLTAMSSHPKLIERPIAVQGNRAVLGRPAENFESLL